MYIDSYISGQLQSYTCRLMLASTMTMITMSTVMMPMLIITMLVTIIIVYALPAVVLIAIHTFVRVHITCCCIVMTIMLAVTVAVTPYSRHSGNNTKAQECNQNFHDDNCLNRRLDCRSPC